MTCSAPAAPPQRMLFSVKDVAAELGCSPDTVYALITRGDLRSITVGGRLRRIRTEDLRAYIDSRVATTPSR